MTLIYPSVAYAAHPLITDDTGTQGKRKFQVEFTGEATYDKETDLDGKTRETGGELSAIVSYGIIDNIDIVLGIPYQWARVKVDGVTVSDEDGLSDISLEGKWRFYDKERLSFALKPGITLPTGNEKRGLGAGRATYSMVFITTKEIKKLAFHLNLSYTRNENKVDERNDIWHASLASELEVVKDLKAVANIGIERNPDKSSSTDPAFLLGGLIYSLLENLDIDLGFKVGL
nr:transporter [candidate division Zixibacteria bacterium]